MTTRFRLPFFAIALLPTAVSAQPARDFQLPPSPAPSERPEVEGPIDSESGPVSRPRTLPSEWTTPAPAPAPAPTIDLPPILPQESQPVPRDPVRSAPVRRTAPDDAQTRSSEPSQPSERVQTQPSVANEPVAGDDLEPIPATPLPVPEVSPELEPVADTPGFGWLGWLAALGFALVTGFLALRRRKRPGAPPIIERPIVAETATDAALNLRVEALKLSRSVMNATLFYRVTVLNRSPAPLSQVAVEADLASASSDTPIEAQVANADSALEPRHERQRLAAGQSARFEGQVVLPLSQAKLLRQGQVALLVPLLRMRATAAGIAPVAKTFAIGPAASGGNRVSPFRLDEGPRSYEPLAQKQVP